ncbi:MAG: hypothetical protein GTO45_31410 [Candidatus Aminicenantes bacterium]|nr:hypothetical protein [Candidatus Aminicenantes bacterium]NIM83317.1 hypothetical protein [Candidatus Aminicenantes bacterium]NIN22676.1 hypothetical protein [Candidatus Aminicenantes bacterium]NIN46436.1 hypothetical protein [Candidatus Aminicenantes bacterium]NIN89288.1 hypothetical protein [Candidatus Aminicenantes bacterium]
MEKRRFICLFLVGVVFLFSIQLMGEEVTITKVGEWCAASYHDVLIEGNYAYCAAGYAGLDIIDISQPANPQKTGNIAAPAKVRKIHKIGPYIYLTVEDVGLWIIDVSIPALPTRVGYLSGLGNVNEMAVKGDYAYIVNYNGLRIIDVSNPSSPFQVNFYERSHCKGISISGQYAYLIRNYGGLEVLDISNPTEPVHIGSFEDIEDPGRHCIVDNRLYIIFKYWGGFKIIDISDPRAPSLAGTYEAIGGIKSHIAVKGNHVFLERSHPTVDLDVSHSIEVVDISNPANPISVGYTSASYGSPSGIIVKGDYVYTANYYTGLRIFDISDPTAPDLVGSHTTAAGLRRIYVNGQYAYAASRYSGLVILDISHPSHPKCVGQLDMDSRVYDVYVAGNYAYAATYDNGLYIIDIREPATPNLVGHLDTDTSNLYTLDGSHRDIGIFVKSNHAFLAEGRGGLKIIDISDPSRPCLAGEFYGKGWASGVFVKDDYAYLASRSYYPNREDLVKGSFQIIDVSDPSDPFLTGEIVPGPTDTIDAINVYVYEDYAYIADLKKGLQIIDVSNPASPVLKETFDISGYTKGFHCDGKYAYLTNNEEGVVVVDITNPFAPTLVGSYPMSSSAYGIFGSQQHIYVTDYNEDKVCVFETRDTSSLSQQINLSHRNLYFGADRSHCTEIQVILIDVSAGHSLEWNAATDQEWLNCFPGSGINKGELFVWVEPASLAPGTYTGTITVSSSQAVNSPQTAAVELTVYLTAQTSGPFGVFATPVEGALTSGSIPVTGWALDDIGVQCVEIFREEGKSLIYIGDAVFVDGARPDVEQVYPGYPMNYKAGWGYMMLTNFLPGGGNGTFKIHAIATDLEGNQVTLGTKTIICDNANAVKPFGAIDTPTQGGTASGSQFINYGWVLTPLPNTIPTDGSTIRVWVDGVFVGNPVYNQYRQDIANLFPGYNNSNGAVGYFYLDTTQYENGVHTIQWTAVDDAGNTDGIGSRYFTIQNTDGASDYRNQSAAELSLSGISEIPSDYFQPVRFRKGYNEPNKSSIIYPHDKGAIKIELKELERLVLQLNSSNFGEDLESFSRLHLALNTKHLTPKNASSRRYTCAGYLVVGSALRPLPIGSTFDSERGVFYWSPGPGFVGNYRLVFIEIDPLGNKKKKEALITIRPKF